MKPFAAHEVLTLQITWARDPDGARWESRWRRIRRAYAELNFDADQRSWSPAVVAVIGDAIVKLFSTIGKFETVFQANDDLIQLFEKHKVLLTTLGLLQGTWP